MFLERERERTVTVFDYSFQSVTAFRLDRSYVFLIVPYRSLPFLNFLPVIININDTKDHKRKRTS
jgi:hypothetical protein